MSEILKIKDLNKGAILKQGDNTTLKYYLYDADEENIESIIGTTAEVVFIKGNQVFYRTTGTINDLFICEFKIEEVLPTGVYHIEFLVDGRIFPSAYKPYFTLTPSSKGMTDQIVTAHGFEEVVILALDEVESRSAARLAELESNYATRLVDLETKDDLINAQLDQMVKVNNRVQTVPHLYTNATMPISLNNLIHGVVEYVPETFGGHQYWMGATPYAGSDERLENPTIYYSDDGITWSEPAGVNPLAPNPADTGEYMKWHNSDTFLLYRQDINRMEIWWRRRNRTDSTLGPVEVILRRTSMNGTTWTPEEELFRFNNSPLGDQAMSPSAIYNYENDTYECWLMKGNPGNVTITDLIRYYVADGDGKNWVLQEEFEPTFEGGLEKDNWRIWHGAVSKTGSYYELVATAGNVDNNNGMWAFHAISVDGRTWSKLVPLLKPKHNATDSRNIYHIMLIKTETEHILYYTAIDSASRWTLNRTAISSVGAADVQNVSERNNFELEKRLDKKMEAITDPMGGNEYYVELASQSYQSGTWTWPGGMKIEASANRRALARMSILPNVDYEISGFSATWEYAMFLSSADGTSTFNSGWKQGKFEFKTYSQDVYFYIAVRRIGEGSIGAGAFESENPNALLRSAPKSNYYIERINSLEDELSILNVEVNELEISISNTYQHLKMISGVELIVVESGRWTFSGGSAIGSTSIKGSDNTTVRAINKLAVLPNTRYVLSGLDTAWSGSYHLLDAEGKITADGGNLSNNKPNWQTEGYPLTTTSTTSHIVFTMFKTARPPITTGDYNALAKPLTIKF